MENAKENFNECNLLSQGAEAVKHQNNFYLENIYIRVFGKKVCNKRTL